LPGASALAFDPATGDLVVIHGGDRLLRLGH